MSLESVFPWMVAAIAGGPAASFLLLAAIWFFGPTPGERLVRAVVIAGNAISLSSAVSVAAIVGFGFHPGGVVPFGTWFDVGGYGFELGFRIDTLSSVMTILVASVRGLIAHFSTRYLHAQPGFTRFFLLLALFATGMQLLVLGATLDVLFVGWELVGLSSALLVAYFHERRTPVQAGLRVFITYRVCDLGLLVAVALLSQATGSADLVAAPEATQGALGGAIATTLPLALLFAAMGKSAQFPVGGWLPRAMEGPTPSSALFYGALSVHAGVYLLLRAQPLFAASTVATVAIIGVGVVTAIHATLVGRVQSDAKSTLAYATMTQVGVMLVEIGLGLTTLALVHLVGHVLLRCHQLLRAPSALRDARWMDAARLEPSREPVLVRLLPAPLAAWIYRFSLERFGLDVIFERALVAPLFELGTMLDRMERRFIAILTGEAGADASRELPASSEVRPR